MTALMRIEDAAAELGLPRQALRAAAERHGLIVRIGRAVRIEADSIPELIRLCRSAPKAPASTGTPPEAAGSFETLASQKSQQALQTAQMLKNASPSTSPRRAAQVVHLARKHS